jgi:hypothetical protein
VAALLGIKRNTWLSYVARYQGNPAPQPDGREELSGKPWWYRKTITEWDGPRRGQAWRNGVRETDTAPAAKKAATKTRPAAPPKAGGTHQKPTRSAR